MHTRLRTLAPLGLSALALTALSLVAPAEAAGTASWPDLTAQIAPTGEGSKDAAVIVAIENYTSVDDIAGARANADAWLRWFVSGRGIAASRVFKSYDGEATDLKIRELASKAAGAVQPGGTLWFVFIGHGAPSKDGTDGLIVGADANRSADGIYQRSVSRTELLGLLDKGAQAQTVALIDACFSGQSGSGQALVSGLQPLVPTALVQQSSARTRVLTAAGSGEFSGPLSGAARPAFSYLALGGLMGWADGSAGERDGKVSAAELQSYVAGALNLTVEGRSQTPSLIGSDAVLGKALSKAAPDLLAIAEGVRGAGTAEQVPAAVDIVEAGAWSAADDVVLKAMVDAETSKVVTAARARAEQALSARAVARVKEVASEWTALSAAFGAPEAAGPEAVSAVSAKVTEWRSDAVRAAAQDVPLGGSVSYKGRTRALSATVRVDEVRVAVDHGATIALAEAWLGKAKAASKAATPSPQGVTSNAAGRDYQSPTVGTMKWIPAGTFMMGSPSSEAGRYDDEGPQHEVTLRKGFWLMEHEVTQGEWQAVMGSNPSRLSSCGPTCPVERVSWDDAVEFARRASAKDGVPYRLPTEAEWEYAARGGQSYVYAGSSEATSVGWISDNSGSKTHAVCGKARNGYGLCDMTGNVFEWTADWFGTYPSGSATDPTGPSSGSYRVNRGGSWNVDARIARVARRCSLDPGVRNGSLGFRLLRTYP